MGALAHAFNGSARISRRPELTAEETAFPLALGGILQARERPSYGYIAGLAYMQNNLHDGA